MTRYKVINAYHKRLFEETLKIKNQTNKAKKSELKDYGKYLTECIKDVITVINAFTERHAEFDLTSESIILESSLSNIIFFKLSTGLSNKCLYEEYNNAKYFLSEINKVMMNIDAESKSDFNFIESIYEKGKTTYIENEKKFDAKNKFISILKTGLML